MADRSYQFLIYLSGREKRREKDGKFISHTGRRAGKQDCLYDTGVWRSADRRECSCYMGDHGGFTYTFSGTGS